jgi:predicted ribosomally synthesized peptide with nif11-like leader
MSKEATERFVTDAKTNRELQNALEGKVGIPALVEVANRHGYDVTEADVREYSAAHKAELTEKELEVVAGGAHIGIF